MHFWGQTAKHLRILKYISLYHPIFLILNLPCKKWVKDAEWPSMLVSMYFSKVFLSNFYHQSPPKIVNFLCVHFWSFLFFTIWFPPKGWAVSRKFADQSGFAAIGADGSGGGSGEDWTAPRFWAATIQQTAILSSDPIQRDLEKRLFATFWAPSSNNSARS